jgi:hypothetical protein
VREFKVGERYRVTRDENRYAGGYTTYARENDVVTIDNPTLDNDGEIQIEFGGDTGWILPDALVPVNEAGPINEQALVAALKIVGVPDSQHDQIVRAYNLITEVLA